MSATPDSTLAKPEQLIADLRRQLAECKAERDEALAERDKAQRGLAERTAERDEALEQQTAASEVLQVINSSPGDLAPVFDAMLERAIRLCGAPFGILRTWDGERTHLAAVQGDHEFTEWARQRGPFIPHGAQPIARIIAGENIVTIADALSTEAYKTAPGFRELVDRRSIRSLITVALRKDAALLGTVTVYRQEVRPFTEKEIALVRNFAAQAVIAMENARLLTETREALDQQTATAEVLQVINVSPGDLAPVFDSILEKAHTLCGATKGSFVIVDGEHFRTVAMRGLSEAYATILREAQHNPPGSAPDRLLNGENLVHLPDASHSEFPVPRAAAELEGARTIAYVPLRTDGALLGYITAYREEVRPFSDKQIALLQNFAAQAVIAMENARLLTETRETLEQQTATAEVLQVINSSPGDLTPVFDAMLERAIRLCEATYGHMFTYDGELFHLAAISGPPGYVEWSSQLGPVRSGPNAPLGRISRGERIVHVTDVPFGPDRTGPSCDDHST